MENRFKDKHVLVTGGTGFIGSHLIENLHQANAITYSISRNPPSPGSYFSKKNLKQNTRIVLLDLIETNPENIKEILKENRINYVFHLAGQALIGKADKDPQGTLRTNLQGTTNILEACRLLNESDPNQLEGIVVASSINVYGQSTNLPFVEDKVEFSHKHPYELSMLGVEIISQLYSQSHNLPLAIARLSNIYGPGDMPERRLVPIAIKKILGENEINLTNNGNSKRSFIYIEDAIHGLLTLASKSKEFKGQSFNIGSENPSTIREIVEYLLSCSDNANFKINFNPQYTYHDRDQYLNIGKSLSMLGWKPRISLEEGLRRTFEWYKQNQTK